MCVINWGTVPEWLTFITAAVSVVYLIDYANSARRQVAASRDQVEAMQQPLLTIRETAVGVVIFTNEGVGAAINVSWDNGKGQQVNQAIIPVGADGVLCDTLDLKGKKQVVVNYESISGVKWRSIADWVRTTDNASEHIVLSFHRIA